MPKPGYTSYSDEKYHSTFSTKMREEFATKPEDVKRLSDYLGVSVQAVNQYKQGTGFPKTENLIRIAQYYNCSLDYLIGLSDVKTPAADIQAINEYTGLSQKSIELLHRMQESIIADKTEHNYAAKTNQATIDIINLVLDDANIKEGDFPFVETLFSEIYCYIHAEDASINLEPAFPDSDTKLTPEECRTAAKAMGITEKDLWVNYGNYFKQTSVIDFARKVLMDKITDTIKRYARRNKHGKA